jgi:hypothetical protein
VPNGPARHALESLVPCPYLADGTAALSGTAWQARGPDRAVPEPCPCRAVLCRPFGKLYPCRFRVGNFEPNRTPGRFRVGTTRFHQGHKTRPHGTSRGTRTHQRSSRGTRKKTNSTDRRETNPHSRTSETAYRNQPLCRVSRALGKALNTLGKGFVECHTRQRAHGKEDVGKAVFAECLLSDTRQRLCRVSGTRQRPNRKILKKQEKNFKIFF